LSAVAGFAIAFLIGLFVVRVTSGAAGADDAGR
jgi:hypothetical protein